MGGEQKPVHHRLGRGGLDPQVQDGPLDLPSSMPLPPPTVPPWHMLLALHRVSGPGEELGPEVTLCVVGLLAVPPTRQVAAWSPAASRAGRTIA